MMETSDTLPNAFVILALFSTYSDDHVVNEIAASSADRRSHEGVAQHTEFQPQQSGKDAVAAAIGKRASLHG